MATMRAVEIKDGKGPAEALFIGEIPRPKPGKGTALVRVRAFGLNRMDLIQRNGFYPVPPQAPSTLGVEFSGTIEELGDEAESAGDDGHKFARGDEVFGLAYGGAYAEFVEVNTRMLLHKPAHLSFEQAAAIPETWITATQALHLVGGFRKGEKVLWHAGASGVSVAGIQLSRAAGASAIFATAGTPEKCDFLKKELGATAAYNYKVPDPSWAGEILRATDGQGVDVIVDFIGGDYLPMNMDAVARDGRIVQLAFMGGKESKIDLAKLLYKRVRLEGSTLRSRDVEYQGRLRDRLEEYMPLFDDGTLKVIIDRVFPWEEIVEAHKTMESNKTMGKLICTIKQD